MSLRIVFAGTPNFSSEILKSLLQSSHSIVGVLTQPDRIAGRGRTLQSSPVKKLALEHHIPVYQPHSLKHSAEQTLLKQLNADLWVVVAYGLILPQSVLTIPRLGCINIHASLLPRWRGASPIQQAILANDSETGICIMQMDEGLDTGDILSTYRCAISPTETTESLTEKLITLGKSSLLDTLTALEEGTLCPIKQNNIEACYAPKISKQDAKINWHESAAMIDRKIRAFNPWPVAFTDTLRIWSANPTNSILTAAPGTMVNRHNDAVEVATGAGTLQLSEVQFPGGKRLVVKELLKAKHGPFQSILQQGFS